MRNLLIAVAASAALLVSGAAHALDVSLALTNNFGLATADQDLAAQTATGGLGDTIELTITVANPAAEDIFSVFTFITQSNPAGLALDLAGPTAEILVNPGAPPFTPKTQLNSLGDQYGLQAANQPAGTLVAVAHTGGGASTDGTGPDAALVLIMAISDLGQNDIGQALLSANGASEVNLSGGVTVNIPEPGTALLMGLGLAGLATAGRRED